MASYTPNLNLYKKDPIADGNDFFNIKTMMNDNWDKIDDSVKAALDDIEDLQSEQVRIATGSYVGTGTYGASNPCSLTFPFSPKLLIVQSTNAAHSDIGYATMLWTPGTSDTTASLDKMHFTSSGSFLSWYTDEIYNAGEGYQMNRNGIIYVWVAFG